MKNIHQARVMIANHQNLSSTDIEQMSHHDRLVYKSLLDQEIRKAKKDFKALQPMAVEAQ